MRKDLLGYVFFLSGCVVVGSSVTSIGMCLLLVGVSIWTWQRGLYEFRQFLIVDLIAFVSFLPAAASLMLRHSAFSWAAHSITLIALTCITALMWMDSVNAMNRAQLYTTGVRLIRWIMVFGLLAFVWLAVLAVAIKPVPGVPGQRPAPSSDRQ